MTNVYLDLDEHIKPFLGIGQSNDKQDKLLNLLNKQSAKRLDNILNVSTLAKHTVTSERFDGGVCKIRTKDFPVLSVTSILEGSTETPYTQTASYLIERDNIVVLDGSVGGGKGYEQNKITYVAGYVTYEQNDVGGTFEDAGVTFPDDLQHANLLLLAGMYNQSNAIGVKTYSLQGKTVTLRDDIESGEFESIINKYVKPLILSI